MSTVPRSDLAQVHDHRLSRPVAVIAALAAPLLVAALLGAFGGVLANTSSALILVLVIIGAACTGYRSAGLLAAVSAAVWFDFFLTVPRHRFSVADPGDLETLVVLLLIGIAANELIARSRRSRAHLRDQDLYLNTLLAASDHDRPISSGVEGVRAVVAEQIAAMLDLDECRWVDEVDPTAPVLHRDGQLREKGRVLAIEGDGWPTDTAVMLPLGSTSGSGGFALTSATHVIRPTVRQRQLAGALTEQLRTGQLERRVTAI